MKRKYLTFILLILFLFVAIEILPNRTVPNKAFTNGIYELKEIILGNYKQTILIRGSNRNNPIIVFIHGGPGFASISYAKKFQTEIEKKFVVVNWDQRGSGKSYSMLLKNNSMNEQQLLNDLNELVDYLCNNFNKEAVYIVGHSWGTILGKDYVQAYPEKVEYYISIGQFVSEKDSAKYSFNFLLNESLIKEDQKIIDKLSTIGEPPYNGNIKSEIILRKCINDYGGNEVSVNINREMLKGTILEPEYSILDLLRLFIGNYYSLYYLHDDFSDRDFRTEELTFDVPVLFILGDNDLVTNFQLAEEYFDIIECPNKQIIWFENSGHDPQYEEVKKFSNVIAGLL